MTPLSQLQERIQRKDVKVAVIGLGYVGLPVAYMLAEAGFQVTGVDLKLDRIEMINRGESPIEGKEPGLADLLERVIHSGHLQATSEYNALCHADIILIDVETPIDENHIPQYHALRAACRSLGEVLKEGALVVVESTIAPGTMDSVVRPILEDTSGKVSKEDFFLGACPERVMPGKLLSNLRMMSRVCGGDTEDVAHTMVSFYRNIVQADLDPADLITAELTKTAENAYRDVNIAFANELALICQSVGADFLKVRELVNKSPGRRVLYAGAGVGGHCIPKDPWLLAYGVKDKVDLKLIPAAREINDSMPSQMVSLLRCALKDAGLTLEGAKVAILGYAYLEDSEDTRNSPSEVLEKRLLGSGVNVVVHDPFVKDYNKDIIDLVHGCDAILIMVAHFAYRSLDLNAMRRVSRHPILIDGRRVINPDVAGNAGFKYYAIGYGSPKTCS
jgi:UDP-N-acetyl-D-mannosaminuronic acid dehydrogenase